MKTEPTLTLGTPEELFSADESRLRVRPRRVDVAPGGQRRLGVQSLEDDARLRAIGLGVREASAAAVANTITGAANALNQLMTAGSTNTLSLMSAVQETAHKTVRTGLFEIDKLENIDEVNAYASILAAAIARELNRDKSE